MEPTDLAPAEDALSAFKGGQEDGRRRATRRLKLLAGLLSRGTGEGID